MTTPAAPVHYHLANTLGALFVANCAVSALFGVTTTQTITYFNKFPKDTSFVKFLVFLLWIFDLVHFVLNANSMYEYSVTEFGNPAALGKITWSGIVVIILTVHSDSVVRGMFAFRIWKLSKGNVILLTAIVITAIPAYASGIAVGIRSAQYLFYDQFHHFQALLYFCMCSIAFTDIVISGALCVLLWKTQSTFKRTQTLIRTLIIYAINTGAFTSLCAIGCLVAFAASPSTPIFQVFYLVLPELYLNSLLATLNARDAFRKQQTGASDHLSFPLSSVSGTHVNLHSYEQNKQTMQTVNIQVDSETITDQKPNLEIAQDTSIA